MPQAASSSDRPSGSATPGANGVLGRAHVEGHRPAEKEAGIEIAEQKIRVRHRRLVAAERVCRGPRRGAGAFRADPQATQGVDAGHRAAPGADLDHLDHRHLDGQTALLPEPVLAVDLELRRDQRIAVRDHAGLGGGAAHVEGEDIVVPEQPAVPGRGQGAARRSGLHQPDRGLGARVDLHQTAVGLHEEQGRRNLELRVESIAQAAEILLRDALHVDVGQHGRPAHVLADLGHELAGQRDLDAGQDPAQEAGNTALVRVVGVGVDQRDADGLDPVAFETPGKRSDVVILQRGANRPVGEHAFVELEAQPPRRQGTGAPHAQVVDVVAMLATDLDRVAKSPSGDESGPGPLAFDQGIDEERGAVHHAGDLGPVRAESGQQPVHAFDHRIVGLIRGGEDLLDLERRSVPARDHEIGERAADVSPHAQAHRPCPPRLAALAEHQCARAEVPVQSTGPPATLGAAKNFVESLLPPRR